MFSVDNYDYRRSDDDLKAEYIPLPSRSRLWKLSDHRVFASVGEYDALCKLHRLSLPARLQHCSFWSLHDLMHAVRIRAPLSSNEQHLVAGILYGLALLLCDSGRVSALSEVGPDSMKTGFTETQV